MQVRFLRSPVSAIQILRSIFSVSTFFSPLSFFPDFFLDFLLDFFLDFFPDFFLDFFLDFFPTFPPDFGVNPLTNRANKMAARIFGYTMLLSIVIPSTCAGADPGFDEGGFG